MGKPGMPRGVTAHGTKDIGMGLPRQLDKAARALGKRLVLSLE